MRNFSFFKIVFGFLLLTYPLLSRAANEATPAQNSELSQFNLQLNTLLYGIDQDLKDLQATLNKKALPKGTAVMQKWSEIQNKRLALNKELEVFNSQAGDQWKHLRDSVKNSAASLKKDVQKFSEELKKSNSR